MSQISGRLCSRLWPTSSVDRTSYIQSWALGKSWHKSELIILPRHFYGHAHKLVCLSYFYNFSCRFRSSCTVDLRQSSAEVVWGRHRAWSWGRRWAWHISCSPWESTMVLPGATRGRRGRGRRERKSVRTSSSSSGNLFQRFVHVYSFIVYKHTYMYQAIQLTVGSLCTSVNYILNSSWACFSHQ